MRSFGSNVGYPGKKSIGEQFGVLGHLDVDCTIPGDGRKGVNLSAKEA
jgi:hypothetical protein